MEQHIHCLVNDCHYWSPGNVCKASEIIVATDKFAEAKPDEVDAKMAKQLEPTPAGSPMSTCCKTYVAKGSAKTTADAVTRTI
ncbi:MAG TPA: DUF1540 domain-containing protein [Desulfotomaculum sp.]|nr:DUF1540 domain-containing protein [Desulfotomaculum sp.]